MTIGEQRKGLSWTLDQLPGRIRTDAILRYGMSQVAHSAATLCQCGGLLAEDDRGHVWCLKCEEQPRWNG